MKVLDLLCRIADATFTVFAYLLFVFVILTCITGLAFMFYIILLFSTKGTLAVGEAIATIAAQGGV